MKWLPSFVTLFLVFVLGVFMLIGGSIGWISSLGNYTAASLFEVVRILGLLLLVVSPLLMGLKFFSRLDKKS